MNALKSKCIIWILIYSVFVDASVHVTKDIFKVPFLCVDSILTLYSFPVITGVRFQRKMGNNSLCCFKIPLQ